MTTKTLLLLGATGLVGQEVLKAALAEPGVARVVAPTRRALPPNAKLHNPIVDFDALPGDAPWWRADAAICTLGTTLRQAGSKRSFHKVDHDYVLSAAARARAAGTPVFVLNSSVGAEPTARSFYLRVKGETEQDLQSLGFGSLTLVRPSLLDGGKRPESRPGEAVGLWLARRFAAVIPAHYKAVSTTMVARCMLDAALAAAPGVRVIESEEIGRAGA